MATRSRRAQNREQMAIDAVRRFGDVVRETPELKNNPSLSKLRATLLKEPQAFFKSLRDRLQADPEMTPDSLARLAAASFDLGRLTNEIGDKEDALRTYAESLAIRERLVRENPSVARFQSDLAKSYNNVGSLQSETGRPAEALASYEQARAIRERLVRENPSVSEFQSDLAGSHQSIGILQHETGRPAEAMASYEKARAIWERLVRENPSVTDFQRDLALNHYGIGVLQGALALGEYYMNGARLRDPGQEAEALASFERARAIQERLARENPSVTGFQSELAMSQNIIGILQSAMGRPGDALESYDQARVIQERLAREHPESPDFASLLGGTLHNMAVIDLGERRFDKAQARLTRAIEWQRKALLANPGQPDYRKFLDNHLSYLVQANEGLVLDARLAAVLTGTKKPKDDAERIQLANRAYEKALHATSARLYAEALANDPKLADDRQAGHRYNAACAAALAGCGQGKDDPPPNDAAKTKLRQQAFDWLQSELAAWAKVLATGPAGLKANIAPTLKHWKADADLAGIRDEKELAKLPEPERAALKQLWTDVDRLLTKAAGGK